MKLQCISQQTNTLRAEIDALRQLQHEESVRVADSMLDGLPATELHILVHRRENLADQISNLHQRLRKLDEDYHKQRAVFLRSRERREVIERLRNQEHEAYVCEEARREQIEADETFLLRRQVNGKALPNEVGNDCRATLLSCGK
ncbi:MAG TPA: flagellar export protein FliJ [Terriglobales bacterium]|nr:flagellar export protein FliJ [Terriglobales bacterium]